MRVAQRLPQRPAAAWWAVERSDEYLCTCIEFNPRRLRVPQRGWAPTQTDLNLWEIFFFRPHCVGRRHKNTPITKNKLNWIDCIEKDLKAAGVTKFRKQQAMRDIVEDTGVCLKSEIYGIHEIQWLKSEIHENRKIHRKAARLIRFRYLYVGFR